MTPSVGANLEVTPLVDANTKNQLSRVPLQCGSTCPPTSILTARTFGPNAPSKHGLKLVLHERERRFAGVGGFGSEHGHWMKPLRACADQRRAAGFFCRLLLGPGVRHQH